MTGEIPELRPITVLDLFAGCGGLTEGFHQFRPSQGHTPVFRTVGAVEWDAAAAATYSANFGPNSARRGSIPRPDIFQRDITGWNPPWGQEEIDVVVGGPPCQGFSGLNRLGVGSERNHLWEEFVRVVVLVQPKVFVIENVDRFLRSPEFADLLSRVGSGDLSNYALVQPEIDPSPKQDSRRSNAFLLNAADFGSPQARRRAIVLGVRTDGELDHLRMRYPERTHAKANQPSRTSARSDKDRLPPWNTVDSVFKKTSRIPLAASKLPHRPRTEDFFEGRYEGQGTFSSRELHLARDPEELSQYRYAAIPAGGNRTNLRGRYLLRTDAGERIILQKTGLVRNHQARLNILGNYKQVSPLPDSSADIRVVAYVNDQVSELPTPRRGRDRTYRVDLELENRRLSGVLEYLSTPSWDAHNGGSGDVMGRLRLGSPSVTVRTEFFKPEKGRYLHPTLDRPITHYEAAIIQGFPADYKWCGSKTEIAKQIGNAVPIPLGKKIAEAIFRYLRETRDN